MKTTLAAALLFAATQANALVVETGADWSQSFDLLEWVPATVCGDDATALCPGPPSGGNAFFRKEFHLDALPTGGTVEWNAVESNVSVDLNGAFQDSVVGYTTHSAGRNIPASAFAYDNTLLVILAPREGNSAASRISLTLTVGAVPEPSTYATLVLGLLLLGHRIPRRSPK